MKSVLSVEEQLATDCIFVLYCMYYCTVLGLSLYYLAIQPLAARVL